jgi:hypothetical protein
MCNILPDITNRITVNPRLIPSVTNITLSYSNGNVFHWLSYNDYTNDPSLGILSYLLCGLVAMCIVTYLCGTYTDILFVISLIDSLQEFILCYHLSDTLDQFLLILS